MPTATPQRSVTAPLLRGLASFLGLVGAVSFFWGGRALNEFFKFDRMIGEMICMPLALVFGATAFWLKERAQELEDHGDGEPDSTAIDSGTVNEKSDS